ncbi:MAG: sodium-dependent transporter [candidate division Zixibacteria bacterium]|nr:sodium-dependent transporter [candidate division Zixibacteria bacterium]
MAEARERWGTKLGVIMAVAGSAIGLGNFLRFPVQAAQNGGGAFMIPYIAALLLIGVPMMWVEWTAGRYGSGFGHSSAPGIFQSLWPKNPAAKYIGVLGLVGPLVIIMYYVYIESWTLAYSYYSLTGALTQAGHEGSLRSFLAGLQGLERNQYFSGMGAAFTFFLITFLANMAVVYFGIKGGIERFCNIAMPVLLIFGLLLAVRVLTLFAPNPAHPDWSSTNGLGFLWNPDFSALKSPRVWLAAAGQIFFTLSLGMGVILTYASYVRKQDDVALSGLTAAGTNEFAEVVLGGSIIIPAAFAFFGPEAMVDIAHSGSFNLGFVTMPAIFSEIPLSWLFSFFWFFMLFLAGITSSISLSQPLIAFLEDEFKLSRRKAVLVLAITVFLLCQPGIWFLSHGVIDDLDFWGGNFVIVLGATVEIIIVAWIFGIDKTWSELETGAKLKIPRFFKFVIKYVTPVLLLAILGAWFFEDWIPVIMMENVPAENVPYVLGTRLALVAVIVVLCIMVRIAWQRRRRETGREV